MRFGATGEKLGRDREHKDRLIRDIEDWLEGRDEARF